VGGTAGWILVLIEGLERHGIEAPFVCGEVEDGEVEDSRVISLSPIRIRTLRRRISIKNDFVTFWVLRKTIRKQSPDLVATHTAKAGLIGRLATFSIFRNRPATVHTFHGHLFDGYFSPRISKSIIWIERKLASRTDMLIAAGERVKDDCLSAGIGIKNDFRVISPGVEIKKFIKKSESRNRLDISNNEFVVGWLGRLSPIKNPQVVLDLAKTFPEITFLIGGGGPLQSELELKKSRNVKLVGWTTPEEFWPACDIAILTSLNEAQPLSVIEAAQCGIPTIATNVGSVSEVILNDVTGYIVNELKQFQEKLEMLKSSNALRCSLGEAAKHRALNNFSTNQFVTSHIDAYQDLVRRIKC